MDSYLAAGLAMCLIVLLALAATAYLAVHFNRRAKVDLAAALSPLARLLDGDVDLDTASIRGRHRGQLIEARMANASEGPGRVFQTDVIDAAGGAGWLYTSAPARGAGDPPRATFETESGTIEAERGNLISGVLRSVVNPQRERFRLEYDPGPGHIRLTQPMRTRRDIPDVATFHRQLDVLIEVGDLNRRLQGTEAAATD